MSQDCPTNSEDCLPAGSNPTDPCSPCFEPTTQNFMSVLSELARQVCALGNQIKSFNQRLDKVRNQVVRLERTISNLPDPENDIVNVCSNSETAEDATAIVVCDDGVQKLFPATECGSLFAKDGLWKMSGPKIRWLATPQTLVIGANTSLEGYEEAIEDGCEVSAIIHFSMNLSGNSSTTGNRTYTVNAIPVAVVALVGGGVYPQAGQHFAQMESESITIATLTSAFSGSPTHTNSFKLAGWLIG